MKRIITLGALVAAAIVTFATLAFAATPALGTYEGQDEFSNQVNGEITKKTEWNKLFVTDMCERRYRFVDVPIKDDGTFNAVKKNDAGEVLLRIRGTFVKTVRVEGIIVDKNCEVGGEYVLKRVIEDPTN